MEIDGDLINTIINFIGVILIPTVIFIYTKITTITNKLNTFEYELKNRPTHEDIRNIEDKLEELVFSLGRIRSIITSELGSDSTKGNINKNIEEIRTDIKDMKDSIIGSLNNPKGLMFRVIEMEKQLNNKVN